VSIEDATTLDVHRGLGFFLTIPASTRALTTPFRMGSASGNQPE
jgi:hypothetical protein